MSKSIIFFFFFLSNFSEAQTIQRLEKIVIVDSSMFFYCPSEEREELLLLVGYLKNSVDTIFKYSLPSGEFRKNVICWDVFDHKLFKISLFIDNQNKADSHLRFYEIDSMINFTSKNLNTLRDYKNNRSRSLSAYIPPFDLYNNMIYYRSDTLRGNLYIDFTCSRDSFLFYIYIENKKSLEKWHYTPFSRALGYALEKDKIRQKAWIKQNEYNIDLSGPFRTFSANNKSYLITEDGRIFLIEGDSIKLQGQIPDMREKVLVFDKDQNRLLTTEKSIINSFKESFSIEKIYQNSKPVIDFND
jgi:hypothetical protein